jgi:hypothetical protein
MALQRVAATLVQRVAGVLLQLRCNVFAMMLLPCSVLPQRYVVAMAALQPTIARNAMLLWQ